MSLENDPQINNAIPVNKNGANANTDPTYNVRMLMEANNASLEKLCMVELHHVEDTQKLHVFYQEKLTTAEAKRIDAILDANVKAQQQDRERAAETAQILANQVTSSAETQRSLVASTAAAQAASQSQTTTQMNERISQLEKAQYTGAGKAIVSDPQLEALARKVDVVVTTLSKSEGRTGISNGLMMTLTALGGGILVFIIEALLKAGLP